MSPEASGGGCSTRLLRAVRQVVLPDGPHAFIWTSADEVSQALAGFRS